MREPKRPGVMLYFDLYDVLRQMPMEDAYAVLMAIFEFAQHGVAPKFRNPALTYAWRFIQQSIERDAARYEQVVAQKRKAAQKSWSKKQEDACETEDPDASAYI